MVIEHAAAIGADPDASPFTMDKYKMKKVKETIDAFGYGTVSVTQSYLRDHLIVGTKGAKKPVPPKLKDLIDTLGVTAVLIGLDEAHTIYDKAKFPDAIHAWREVLGSVQIFVIPVTATHNLGRQVCRANIMKLCGMETVPKILAYTDSQAEKFRLDNQVTPPAPTEPTVVKDLGDPPFNDASMMVKISEVGERLVDFFADTNPATTDEDDEMPAEESGGNYGYNRLMLSNAVNSIVVKLAIGTDGGELLDLVTTENMMVKRIGTDKKPSGEAEKLKFESVIIGAKTRATEDEILKILQGLKDKNKDSENKVKVHDLRYKYNESAQSKRAKRKAFKADFNAQTGTVFGIIGQKQHASINTLANIASTYVFIGEQTDTGLKQFFGRGSRPGTNLLKQGDFVPDASTGYKAIHLKSEFGSRVMSIESPSEKITRSNPTLSDEIIAELDDLKKKMDAVNQPHRYSDIKLNTQKLILGDRFLRTNGKIVVDYINSERAKYMPPEEEDEMSEQAVEEIDDGKPSDEQDDDDEQDAEDDEDDEEDGEESD